jgi:hypothetical protein
MKRILGLGLAAVVAAGMLSTSAFALTVFGNNSQKGSLLIYPVIQVFQGLSGVDTLITLTNDSSLPVLLKCYYATSDPLPTPYTGTAAGARSFKHFEDFTINVTHNQPIAWWASTGLAYSASQKFGGSVAPPFGNPFPDGQTRNRGELKCWAITDDGSTQKNHNHLYGTASTFLTPSGQASEYTAWAFQAIAGAPEAALGNPGVLNLNNVDYDACPNILLGNFLAGGTANVNLTGVALASCNQDLRQAYTPTITKLTWTFFNQDEETRTGTHTCADSWFEAGFPATNFPFTTFAGLGTEVGYFRIETTADTQICGPDAQTSAYVGVIEQLSGAGNFRATNLTGRGPAFGVIKYDVSPPDGSMRPQ